MESKYDHDFCEIGKRIRLRRDAIGMTQKELAEKSGIDDKSISRLELGQSRMRVDNLVNIAAALGVTLNDISPPRLMKNTSSFDAMKSKYNLLTPEQQILVDQTMTTMMDILISQR